MPLAVKLVVLLCHSRPPSWPLRGAGPSTLAVASTTARLEREEGSVPTQTSLWLSRSVCVCVFCDRH